MGLIKAAMNAGSSVLADQWLEYVYCDRMDDNVLMRRGIPTKGGSNTKGGENIITNGSKIIVNEDQFLICVSNGKIVDFTAEPGRYTFDKGTEPSMLYGGFGKGLIDSFKKFGERFTGGGVTMEDQRVYFINTRHIKGNKFGTSTPIPFRDSEFGMTVDIRCHGEYIFQVTNPINFYHTFGGNINGDFVIDESFRDQFQADFLAALNPALSRVSMKGISYDMLPGAIKEVSEEVKSELDSTWGEQGINVVRVSIASATPTDESAATIKSAQSDRSYAMNPEMMAARANRSTSKAMEDAANNSAGAMTGFMGMGMVNQTSSMYGSNMAAQNQGFVPQPMGEMNVPQRNIQASVQSEPEIVKDEEIVDASITPDSNPVTSSDKHCSKCGAVVNGKFCSECGTKYEEKKQKFCSNCGAKAGDNDKFCGECGNQLM